ncbi:Alcohol dehydrogenase [NADP(+)], partial [Dispira parvispora]
MPAIGLGTWRANLGEMDEIIKEAWNLGYRHIDCAPFYRNEREIGTALKRAKVVRDQLWITSKLWNTEHHPDHVGPACEKTLRDLQVDSLDLYLIHWPLAFEHSEEQIPQDAQ